jgi:hypothetical protein
MFTNASKTDTESASSPFPGTAPDVSMIRLRAAGKRDTSQLWDPSPKHDQFAVSGIAPIRLPARKSTLSETIRQRPMRAGCW